jgi:hypothetical protein
MNQQSSAKQWNLAEAPAIEAIRQAQASSRVVMEMLRLWEEIQALDSKPGAADERE